MNSSNLQVAFSASRWLVEMVLGKPSQAIQVDHDSKELAMQLALALREVATQARMAAPPEPERLEGGNVRVLGARTVKTRVIDDDDFPD
jgi:hypothetical protein